MNFTNAENVENLSKDKIKLVKVWQNTTIGHHFWYFIYREEPATINALRF